METTNSESVKTPPSASGYRDSISAFIPDSSIARSSLACDALSREGVDADGDCECDCCDCVGA